MKKLFAVILTSILAISCLFADDAADVKQTIMRDIEYSRDCKVSKLLEIYTRDIVVIEYNGVKSTYKDYELMRDFLEKNSIEAFLQIVFKAEMKREPDTRELMALQKMAKNENAKMELKYYQNRMKKLVNSMIDLHLKTIKFKDIKINKGKTARVIVEFTSYENPRMISKIQEQGVIDLRKENGTWKICKEVFTRSK